MELGKNDWELEEPGKKKSAVLRGFLGGFTGTGKIVDTIVRNVVGLSDQHQLPNNQMDPTGGFDTHTTQPVQPINHQEIRLDKEGKY